ncbi:2Fe-2S iron-sulfur cluster binding domain-containing protein [Enterobacteriaceae bacterium RIT691]|nr:2Fe-2S iron-sulfur cluster binding domain-containing protein [Enterobacteriaceae bacterium RIT691]
MSDYQMFEVTVRQVETLTSQVKRFTLVAKSGAPLPAFSGGSHIIVQMQDGEQCYSNAYSLMSSPLDLSSWQIAVRQESPSKGGSQFMHQKVQAGDTLTVSTPKNLFALAPQARKHLLIAGGIGITPFLSHIPELERQQAEWQLHYCFHSPDNNAFQDELTASACSDRVNIHISSQGTRLDLAHLLADIEPGTHIYTCGPAALNEAVKAAAQGHGIAQEQLHFEQFMLEDTDGEAFTLVLARSGREFTVPEDMTILQVIENNKAAKVECLCREGVCGTCETMILEGEADHRDQYFSDDEKASQQSMLICCSRAKGPRLVLDL